MALSRLHAWQKRHPRIAQLAVFPLALVLGFVLDVLKVPLSWMIGAMIASMGLMLADVPIARIPGSRKLAQAIVGASVGITFTAEALQAAIAVMPTMLFGTLCGLLTSLCAAAVLTRLTGIDRLTAMLAALSVGPVESAVLAQRYKAQLSPVIFSQSARIALIVLLLPPIVVWLTPDLADPASVLAAIPWTATGAGLLFILALLAAEICKRIRIPNPYFLGPMFIAIVAALSAWPVTGFPYWALTLAQVMMGIWLGASMEREFLKRSHTFVGGMFVSISVLIALSALVGLAVAWMIGLPWQVGLLATAPGGVAEMALTAKIMQQGVAIVISFQLCRIFMMQVIAPLIVAQISKRGMTPR